MRILLILMTSVNVIVTIKVFMRIITYRSCLDMSSYLANNFEKLLGSLCKPNSLAKVWQNLRKSKSFIGSINIS